MNRELTPEYRKRAEQSLNETKALLSKEMLISEDLRYSDKVEFYNSHIVRLETMLQTGKW